MRRQTVIVTIFICICFCRIIATAQLKVSALGQFPEPVRISSPQGETLKKGASRLDDISGSINTQSEEWKPMDRLLEAKRALRGKVSEAIGVVSSAKEDFQKLASSEHRAPSMDQQKAADLFFGDIVQNFRAQDEKIVVSEPSKFEMAKKETILAIDNSAALFNIAASEGSLTFDLEVDSEPQNAHVSYKRTGDPYTPHPNPTDTTIQNLEYAVWTVRVDKPKFESQEKQHNPARERNHVMHFTLVASP